MRRFGMYHLESNGCTHGPQTWPWWRLISFSFLNVHAPSGLHFWRFWYYTKNKAGHLDIFWKLGG